MPFVMALADDISRVFHAVKAARAPTSTVAHVRALVIDALACILAGADTDLARLAVRFAGRSPADSPCATILPNGARATSANAALINGTMLRSLDLMDVYVDVDVSHPSESIPAALAIAEERGATGRAFLDSVVAAVALHTHLAGTIALHRHALHHVGHAAWTVPLIVGRLAGQGVTGSANALNLSAGGLIVPEGFSRGHVANVKAMAFPLIAKRAIELSELGADGLMAQSIACEEVVRLLGRITGKDLLPEAFVPSLDWARIEGVTLKRYPAQYALQPLIAAAAAFRQRHAERVSDVARILVRAAKQTVMRTADPAKFQPASREAADHSLPFCVACGLLDGGLTPATLERERWKDPDILRLTAAMEVESSEGGNGFAIGRQELILTFTDGTSTQLECVYPPKELSWRQIAEEKLSRFATGRDVPRILAIVDNIENEASITPLVRALSVEGTVRARAY